MNSSRPVIGTTNPLSTLRNVVLPAPFGPMMANTSSRPTLPGHAIEGNDATEVDR